MAPTTFILSLLCLVASLLPHSHSQVHGNCIETERIALLSIKASMWINNNKSFLSSWTGHDCCHWRGVSCNLETGHVTKLDLRYPYYDEHTIPPSKLSSSLVHLQYLKHLDLSMNYFNHSLIPDFIGSLANLEYLNLSHAGFSGTIPHAALGNLSRLCYLDLNCKEASIIPYIDDLHWLSGMTSLHHLDLSGVNLSNVSHWLHDINMLSSLLVLKLSYAQLQAGGIHDTTLLHHLNFTSLRVLDLSGNYDLNITLPQWLFNLTSLVYLDLSNCALHGKLPVNIGDLSSLRFLSLSYNSFDGMIPESLRNLSSLEILSLNSNMFNGGIPESINNLTNLVNLDLSRNEFRKLTKRFGGLKKLERLDMSENQVQGCIPESIGELKNIKFLVFSENMLSGEIPESIGNLTVLQHFDGSQCQNLSGTLPETIGNLVDLQYLDLSKNMISGELPQSLGNLMQLQQFKMALNQITGQLPVSIGKLSNLSELDLSYNNISGTLPKSMGNLCNLMILYLNDNFISGSIHDLLNKLSKCTQNMRFNGSGSPVGLTTLALGKNRFNGKVPESLGQFSNLMALFLSSNSFVGVLTEAHFTNLANLQSMDFSFNLLQLNVSENWIPPFNASTIRMCSCKIRSKFPSWIKTQTNLGDLCLSDAEISGEIPSWFWNSSYVNLNLSHNNLEGHLPTSLEYNSFSNIDLSWNNFEGLIPNFDPSLLIAIDLSNNLFYGPIPSYFAAAEEVKVFSFSFNHFNGSIPLFFCNLTALMVLDLSNNDMSGELPLCWNQSSNLEILDLSDNNFSGTIPDCIFSLSYLRSLHLRKNGFSGNLPISLKNYADNLVTLDMGENKLSGSIPAWIGENLLSLVILRLRSNLFEGGIPEQLSNLSSLQVLDLAHNKISGQIPHSFGDFKAMVTSHVGSPLLSVYTYEPCIFLVSMTLETGDSLNCASLERLQNRKMSIYSEYLFISAKGLETKFTKVLRKNSSRQSASDF
ncbi:Non-specific serine/threonine protein kinase protein [Dioscorea alata]|uniref:Non-specific serine/threonine protein kinase protein n=1 Tax=Dioscorea alata TaxID=55571 RepID=A0ACB7WR48_DIOAL|nr:Non-specific serine/threonine protein kinase protein [Dioscorea alata]